LGAAARVWQAMSGDGFALSEYVVPRNGHPPTVSYGTMPKAKGEHGSMLGEVKKVAKNPGPEHYNQNFLNKSFATTARGGTFSKLPREHGKGGMKTPAVGVYESTSLHCTPRLRGGVLGKTDRGCIFFDQAAAEGRWKQSPVKYDGKPLETHRQTPSFTVSLTESRSPRKAKPVGPGYYETDSRPYEKRVLSYTCPKESGSSYLDKHVKGKDKMPGPGHYGFPEAKNEDRSGRHIHAQSILRDHQVTPRGPGVDR